VDRGCPDLNEYERLGGAQLPDSDKEALLRHLEGCDSCALRLHDLPEQDTLVSLLRKAHTLADELSADCIAHLVERLSKLRPARAAVAVGQHSGRSVSEPAPVTSEPGAASAWPVTEGKVVSHLLVMRPENETTKTPLL
jgi:hypothetical protein